MNYLGDTNKMVETPRTDAHSWHDGDYDDPLHAFADFAKQLERELNAANIEIEETRKDVVWLATEKAKLENYVMRLEEAGHELLYDNDNMENINRWRKAKEANP